MQLKGELSVQSNRAFYIILLFFMLLNSLAFSQNRGIAPALLKIKKADSLLKVYPAEKLYLQTDKPNYAIGDTLWYKAYLFNAPTLGLSTKSGIMYIDVVNDSNTFVKHYRLLVKQGLVWGNISLNDFPAGKYHLSAYTTWMRNFSADCFFTKYFEIAAENNDTAVAGNSPDAKKSQKQSIKTKAKQQRAIQNTEVQFLPEGGSLIAGFPAHIGFKAIGEDGKGVNVSGVILDNDNQQVASFSSTYRGMGSFDLNAQPGKRYNAKIMLPGGQTKAYALPEIKKSGTTLHVTDAGKDSLFISLAASNDIAQSGSSYFLIAKARNVICYAATLNFSQSGKVTQKIAKSLFPSGVLHFILMDTQYHPLNERLVFINHHDNLQIETGTDKQLYHPRDSVSLSFNIRNLAGNPVAGNFSIVVTDDSQVNIDSLADNLLSHILLSSEIKGYLEDPGHYLQDNLQSVQALDNLLLTQGWVNYDWQPGKRKTYAAEDGFGVKGRVLSGLQKPLAGVKVTLLSTVPFITKDTLTDQSGHFSFNDFPPIAKPAFILQAVNRHGKSFNVGIETDDPGPPAMINAGQITASDSNTDTTLSVTAKNNRIRNEQAYLAPSGHLLKEVKINAKKIVKDSQNLNGPGNADIILDEADLEKGSKKSWLTILTEKIPNFREGAYTGRTTDDVILWSFLHGDGIIGSNNDAGNVRLPMSFTTSWYFINDKPVRFLVDGIAIGAVNYRMTFLDLKYYLQAHNAEDIKGVEVMNSSRFGAKYTTPFILNPFNIAYIEITTRSGHGPVIDNTPGVYLYKPLPLSLPNQFYKPKYTVKDTTKYQPDTRSTIDWEPNINTAADGKATVSFYLSDSKMDATYIIEGTDGNGNLGVKTGKVKMHR